MNEAIFRAVRFVHPVSEPDRTRLGLSLQPTGAIAMVEDEGAVRQDILMLLSTRPGERVMRSEYGCELHRLVFAPNDETTAGLAVHYVRTAIETWEPRVEILRIDAAASEEDPGFLEVILEYRVRATQRIDWLAFGLSLFGEGG